MPPPSWVALRVVRKAPVGVAGYSAPDAGSGKSMVPEPLPPPAPAATGAERAAAWPQRGRQRPPGQQESTQTKPERQSALSVQDLRSAHRVILESTQNRLPVRETWQLQSSSGPPHGLRTEQSSGFSQTLHTPSGPHLLEQQTLSRRQGAGP